MELGFIAVVALAVITPGADTAIVVRHALIDRRHGLTAVTGVVVGQTCHTSVVVAGLAALLQRSTLLFECIRWVGVAYLAVLAASALRGSIRGESSMRQAPALAHRNNSERASFKSGLLANLCNPKTTLFFGSLLPQFAGPDASTARVATLAIVVVLTSVAWYSVLALAAAHAATALSRPAIARAISGVFALAFAGLATKLALAAAPGLTARVPGVTR